VIRSLASASNSTPSWRAAAAHIDRPISSRSANRPWRYTTWSRMGSAAPPAFAARKSANAVLASSLVAAAPALPTSASAVANRTASKLWPTPAGYCRIRPAAARRTTAGPNWPVSNGPLSNGQDGWQGSEKCAPQPTHSLYVASVPRTDLRFAGLT
jgi:hypothetical protein